jgi:hypothetical protein
VGKETFFFIDRQESNATRLAAAGTAACSEIRAAVPAAAKRTLHYFSEDQQE